MNLEEQQYQTLLRLQKPELYVRSAKAQVEGWATFRIHITFPSSTATDQWPSIIALAEMTPDDSAKVYLDLFEGIASMCG